MDSLRTKKSNKKPWIIGGTVVVGLLILIIVLCVSLSSSAEQETGVTVKTVPEALKFVEDAISKTFEKHDSVRKPLVKDIKILNKRLTFMLDLYKTKTDAEKNGQSYDIKIIEEKLTTVDFVEAEGSGDIVMVDNAPKSPKSPTKESDTKDGDSEEKPLEAKTHTKEPPKDHPHPDGHQETPVHQEDKTENGPKGEEKPKPESPTKVNDQKGPNLKGQ